MSQFKPFGPPNEKKLSLWLDAQENVFPFSSENDSSLLICYILSREIGGPNDDLARFIYDEDQKKKIDRKNLKAQIGFFEGEISVQITCMGSSRLRVTIPSLEEVVFCRGEEIIITPNRIASYIRAQNLTPVFVKGWAQHVAFSSYDLKTDPLLDQLWILRNNDTFLYSQIVSHRQVVFQSMHDIVAHIAGINGDGFRFASEVATDVYSKFRSYFGERGRGNMPSHIIPFLIGLILDDLTQKPFYHSPSRSQAITELLNSLDDFKVNPRSLLILNGFPKHLNNVLQMVRDQTRFSAALLKAEIKTLFQECHSLISEAAIILPSNEKLLANIH